MKIFDLVEKFAGYGFNKSHSAAYALVSYQTLWLKTHFPAEFMAAVMTADMDNTDKIVTLVDECQRMGLTVIPPDVNTGRYRFSVNEDGHIVYGIGAVKGWARAPSRRSWRRGIGTAPSGICSTSATGSTSRSPTSG